MGWKKNVFGFVSLVLSPLFLGCSGGNSYPEPSQVQDVSQQSEAEVYAENWQPPPGFVKVTQTIAMKNTEEGCAIYSACMRWEVVTAFDCNPLQIEIAFKDANGRIVDNAFSSFTIRADQVGYAEVPYLYEQSFDGTPSDADCF
jgi:hypothetical protein